MIVRYCKKLLDALHLTFHLTLSYLNLQSGNFAIAELVDTRHFHGYWHFKPLYRLNRCFLCAFDHFQGTTCFDHFKDAVVPGHTDLWAMQRLREQSRPIEERRYRFCFLAIKTRVKLQKLGCD